MSRGFNGQQILLGADLSHHNYGEINPALFDLISILYFLICGKDTLFFIKSCTFAQTKA